MDNEQEPVKSPVLYKFTNQTESSQMDNILAMFYQGTYDNQLGIMTAWNVETSQEEVLLVGVSLDENGKADCYPLARILSAEDAALYLAPDGLGGYYDPQNPSEVAAAKENMKSYEDAVVN